MGLHIAVCCKQVPDAAHVRIHPEDHTLVRNGVESMVNPFDACALEAALALRERLGDGRVTVVSMGPPQVEEVLRECLAMGADDAVMLSDPAFAGADTWATSTVLALAMRRLLPDLILCGKQAIDGDTAQVGPALAAQLDLPQACYVARLVDAVDGVLEVERLLDEGRETLRLRLPSLCTVVKEAGEPRLPDLPQFVRSRQSDLTAWTAADLDADPEQIGLTGSPTQVRRIFSPQTRGPGVRLGGRDSRETAAQLLTALRAAQVLTD